MIDGRGKHLLKIKKENRKLIEEYFKKNPGSTKRQCSIALKLSYPTILTHVKEIGIKNN